MKPKPGELTTIQMVEKLLKASSKSFTIRQLMQKTNRTSTPVKQSIDLLRCEGKVAIDKSIKHKWNAPAYKYEKAISD